MARRKLTSTIIIGKKPKKKSKLIGNTEPTPKLIGNTEPTPGVIDNQEPTPSLVDNTEPTPNLIGNTEPTPGVIDNQEPTPSLVDNTEPTPNLIGNTEPTPGVIDNQEPTPSLVDNTEQTPGVIDNQEQEQKVVAKKRPTSSCIADKEQLFNNYKMLDKEAKAEIKYCFNVSLNVADYSSSAKYIFVAPQIVEGPFAQSIMFPCCSYFEQKAFFFNASGILQSTNKVLYPLANTLPLWKIVAQFYKVFNEQLTALRMYPHQLFFGLLAELLAHNDPDAVFNDSTLHYVFNVILYRLTVNTRFASLIPKPNGVFKDEPSKVYSQIFFRTNMYTAALQALNIFPSSFVHCTPLLMFTDNFFLTDSASKLSKIMAHCSVLSKRAHLL